MAGNFTDWSIERTLGRGSFGDVWLVRDANGRAGVLKRLPYDVLDRIDLPRLDTIARIRHPNIPEVLDHGDAPDGGLFLVTRYVDGTSLQSLLAERGRLTDHETLRLGIAIARALGALHEANLVHRDVKPENILIPGGDGFDAAQLIDIGFIGERVGEAEITRAGILIGTPVYMSPEQARGQGLTDRADLWALGVVLYECLTGLRPFNGDSVWALITNILQASPNLEVLPSALRPVFARTLEKDAERRIENAGALERALRALLSGEEPERPVAPSSTLEIDALPIPFEPPPAQTRRGYVLALAVSAFVVALVVSMTSVMSKSSGGAFVLPMLGALLLGGAGGWLVHVGLRRLDRSAATQARKRVHEKERVTDSIALTVDQLADRYAAHDDAAWMTRSIALVLDDYRAMRVDDPAKRLELTLKVLDAFMRIESRARELAAPWYQRHEKALAFVGALGTASVTWWGLATNVGATITSEDPSGLITQCPEFPLEATTTTVIAAADARSSLSWWYRDRMLVVGPAFRWPHDLGEAPKPGAVYDVWAERDHVRERCRIEIADGGGSR